MIESLVLGLHIYTSHLDKTNYHNDTPGIYAKADNLVLGYVRNSLGNDSLYVAYQLPLPKVPVDIFAGGITGYPIAKIAPLVTIGKSVYLGDGFSARGQWIPPTRRSAQALAFSIERRFW
jgi:hypothetical protein